MPPAYRRLSASPLWGAQRRFYQTAGLDAWRTGTVPHHVTNSVALAEAYARVVCAFAGKRPSRTPLHVIELGAGSGRFAFLFLRALQRRDAGAPSICYVMTDVAPAMIEFWRGHPALRPFVRARQLDFAQLDAARPGSVRLVLGRREIATATPVDRLVVIANYVFSGLPQDAFVRRGGRLHEWLIRVASPRGRPEAVALTGRPGARANAPYEDDALNGVLSERAHARGVRLFPVAALRCLQHLATLARDDTLMLVADRPDPCAGLDPATLGIGRHGAVSFPVDLAALRAWTRRQGGLALASRSRARHLATTALLLGRRPRASGSIKTAWHRAMAHGGSDALYHRRRALASSRPPALRSVLGLLRASGRDPRVVIECLRPLWPHLGEASPALRLELRDIAIAAWSNYYDLGEPHDVGFDLALLLYAVHAWRDARRLLAASLRSHGHDAATHWNLALCHVALGEGAAAARSFHAARALVPGLNAAGPVTVKLGR